MVWPHRQETAYGETTEILCVGEGGNNRVTGSEVVINGSPVWSYMVALSNSSYGT